MLFLFTQKGWKSFGNNPLGCNQWGYRLRERLSPSSAMKGRELQEKERMVSKLRNIIVLENGLHLCYRGLVKSLIAGIVTNCMFIILCSAWEARTWFVKCWALNSFYWSQCQFCFDPLKHYKTWNNSKSEAMGIPRHYSWALRADGPCDHSCSVPKCGQNKHTGVYKARSAAVMDSLGKQMHKLPTYTFGKRCSVAIVRLQTDHPCWRLCYRAIDTHVKHTKDFYL